MRAVIRRARIVGAEHGSPGEVHLAIAESTRSPLKVGAVVAFSLCIVRWLHFRISYGILAFSPLLLLVDMLLDLCEPRSMNMRTYYPLKDFPDCTRKRVFQSSLATAR